MKKSLHWLNKLKAGVWTQRCANWKQQLILIAVNLDTTYLLPSEALKAEKWVRTLLYPQLQQKGTTRWASMKQIIGTPSLTVVYTKALQIRNMFRLNLNFSFPSGRMYKLVLIFFFNYSLLELGKLLLVYLLFDSVGEPGSFPLGKCL